jgi:hypothetical protein
MKISNKLYKCKVCNKSKQLNEYYIYKSGKQEGKRTSCTCILCTKEKMLTYREENKDKIKGYRESFYTKQDDLYFEQERDRKREWERCNPDKKADSNRSFRQNNKGLVASYAANYRSSKLERTPKWITQQDIADIKSIYKMCNKISTKTGIKHHVDHIIPLQGVLVSGLHIPSNLQVIPSSLNLSKGNTYSPIEDIVCSHEKP